MGSKQENGSSRRFIIKQIILLAITVILVVLFTIPLLKTIRTAANPGQLQATLEKSNNELAGLQTKTDVVRSRMLMGAGDDEAQEKLKKQIEDLQRQVASKELENKHLQDQMALVQTMVRLMNGKSPAAATPTEESWHKILELLTKVFGCIGSIFSGGLFILSWWRKRGQPVEIETAPKAAG